MRTSTIKKDNLIKTGFAENNGSYTLKLSCNGGITIREYTTSKGVVRYTADIYYDFQSCRDSFSLEEVDILLDNISCMSLSELTIKVISYLNALDNCKTQLDWNIIRKEYLGF